RLSLVQIDRRAGLARGYASRLAREYGIPIRGSADPARENPTLTREFLQHQYLDQGRLEPRTGGPGSGTDAHENQAGSQPPLQASQTGEPRARFPAGRRAPRRSPSRPRTPPRPASVPT